MSFSEAFCRIDLGQSVGINYLRYLPLQTHRAAASGRFLLIAMGGKRQKWGSLAQAGIQKMEVKGQAAFHQLPSLGICILLFFLCRTSLGTHLTAWSDFWHSACNWIGEPYNPCSEIWTVTAYCCQRNYKKTSFESGFLSLDL